MQTETGMVDASNAPSEEKTSAIRIIGVEPRLGGSGIRLSNGSVLEGVKEATLRAAPGKGWELLVKVRVYDE